MNRRLGGLGMAVSAMALLSGCGDSDTYVSFGGRAGGQPVFCISAKANCAAPGASLGSVNVDELDNAGNVVRVAWSAKAANSAVMQQRQVTYGIAPTGWETKTPASALIPGRHYRVNGQFYFSVTPNGLVLTESKVSFKS